MKILHTSDWHLGKRLFDRERIDAQRRFGEELIGIVRRENVGLVLVSGDIFDTAVPSGAAENLFYDIVAQLGNLATVVIVSGNHDDPERLAAAKQLARANHIIVVGDFGTPMGDSRTIASGDGWLRFDFDGERVNLVVLPYPTDARTGDIIRDDESYAERVRKRLYRSAMEAFSQGGTRIVMTHLFCAGGLKSGSERDIELGTARIVPTSFLPDCDYCALGHIHRPMNLGGKLYYSGAPMPFTFDDDTEKSVNIFDTRYGEVRKVPLPTFDRLKKIEAWSVDEALLALDRDPEALTQLTLHTSEPLILPEAKALRAHQNMVKMILDVAKEQRVRLENRDRKTPEQIFTEYCAVMNVEPTRELVDLFLSLVGEV